MAPFQIKLASSGHVYDVGPDETIVEVLRANDIEVETSCEAGLCATCQTRYLDGEPEHHDMVLSEEEQTEFVLICCARSLSPLLVLDR
ncbi:MAG: 2Fe-2S iron-sulfur cluster binding domain-containing protein [Chromatiales bacterium]|jgi:ferredoxin|nr:2Fe-2S iron-sulfur cluster binding domain-containing protein [Chromatiales bacterium]